jgi:photosystem II stability/assembly factor-like uncharacterized protein
MGGAALALGAGAAAGAVAGSAAPAALPAKPRPAELMPKAQSSLMLKVVDTGKHLIAVGDRGQILVSNDGRVWVQVEVPVRSPLTSVYFVDADTGWAVGHDAAVVHTEDGGKTWSLQNFEPELEKPFLDVLFLDRNTGFAVGAYGLFEKTTDGGTTWSEVAAPAIRENELHLYSLSRLGNGDLFVTGEQGLLGLSGDGGRTWKKLASPYQATLFGAAPVDDRGVLICGLHGSAYLARDARAARWQKIQTGTVASLFGCGRLTPKTAVAVGRNGTVLLLDTGAGSARPVKSGVGSSLSGAVAWRSGLIVVGESGIQRIESLQ